jgi:hypothetical protein
MEPRHGNVRATATVTINGVVFSGQIASERIVATRKVSFLSVGVAS